MRLRERNLIDQIEQGALDGEAPISGTLLKVIALGGKVGSKELRDWASLELRDTRGSDVEPPQYRKPSAAIMVDFSICSTWSKASRSVGTNSPNLSGNTLTSSAR